jgi:hypothetical protein
MIKSGMQPRVLLVLVGVHNADETGLNDSAARPWRSTAASLACGIASAGRRRRPELRRDFGCGARAR